MNDPNDYGTATPLIPQIESLQVAGLFYTLVSILILVTGFFLAPLGLLFYVQIRNFMKGKTTMERFARSHGDSDQNTRIMNSGIRNDIQVYRMSNRLSSSVSVSQRDSNYLDEHS